jgi:hypothetical protein
MKPHLASWRWIIVWLLIVVGTLCALHLSRPDNHRPQMVAETRQSLREQGFKTDLADFDFSTSPEMHAREAILKATTSNRLSEPFVNHPNLMEIVGNDSAIVVWQQSALKKPYPSWPDNRDEMSWDDFHDAMNENRSTLDAAGETALSGPIQFNLDASRGAAMLLPHLAMLKNLTQTLGSRMVLALHDGDQDAAWTNLLAATRLVTAWNPEPAEISHMVQFADTKLVFNETWQALQTNHWQDERLARLQSEWEAVNFFTNLPEVVAFTRASRIAAYDYDRNEAMQPPMPFNEFLREAWPNPLNIWGEYRSRWRQREYLHGGMYEDEKDVLLFYRDREVEQRNAVQAPTWMQMRQLPGVTNEVFFQSKYQSRVQTMMNLHRITMGFQRQGSSFLGRAAEAEAERRILITAIALERYRGKHDAYPNSLAQLTPEFLKTPLPDFMDGQPLRYRLTDDGHFILYSVGQDCVDNGGKILMREDRMAALREFRSTGIVPEADIVWPLPASSADVAALREKETRTVELRNFSEQQRESAGDWQQSPLRQSRVQKILATKWSADPDDVTYQGRRLSDAIRNGNFADTNHISLAALLTPRLIITGKEPEELTFEIPVNYDMVTNHGRLTLLADADPDDMESDDSGAKVQECARATNNDCLLTWHTIFDPPGAHAIQVVLGWVSEKGGIFIGKGEAIPITTSNLCQFSFDSSTYDVDLGARFHARLPETNGIYSIECVTTNGEHLKTLTGSTSNGEFNVVWNLVDDHGHRLTGETFNSIVHITLPDSGRTQTLCGP